MITPAQLSEWTRTLTAVLDTVPGIELVDILNTEEELKDQGSDTEIVFKIKAGTEAYRLSHYKAKGLCNKAEEPYTNPMWSIEKMLEHAEPIYLRADIDFNIACVKLVKEVVACWAYNALRCRRERPTISDDLRVYLESFLFHSSNGTIGGLLRLVKSMPPEKLGPLRELALGELPSLIERYGDLKYDEVL